MKGKLDKCYVLKSNHEMESIFYRPIQKVLLRMSLKVSPQNEKDVVSQLDLHQCIVEW